MIAVKAENIEIVPVQGESQFIFHNSRELKID